MKITCQALIFLTAVASISCHMNSPGVTPIAQALQTAMDESIRNSDAIGVSAAVIFSDGQLWAGASGISHEGVPITTDMLFDIGSVEKNLQATLCLKLVENGIISLDDPLRKWFPPTPCIDGGITIRQLLNMTSGIFDFVRDEDSPFRIGYVNIDFEKKWTWEEIQTVLGSESYFQPGTRSDYSNTNYIVLKQVIEQVTQSRQSALVEDRLMMPNGLSDTWVDFTRSIPDSMPIAHGWLDTNNDGTAEDIFENSLNWFVSLSPMLVYSTPADMAKWADALYHRKTILKDETLRAMLDFHGPVMREPMMKGYGLGVVDIDLGAILPRWEQVQVYGHLGSQFGYSTFVGYFPEYSVTLAMMFNRGCDSATDRAIATVGGALVDVLLRHLGAKEFEQRDSCSDLIAQLERSPDNIHLMIKIAREYQANEDDHEASLMYEEILKRDPDDRYGYMTDALFWKAAYDGLIRKNPEGLIAFISEHEDYRDIGNAYKLLAQTYQRDDKVAKAVQVYRDALEVVGHDADFYNSYAWWVYENRIGDEYDTAIQYAKAAVELRPDAYYIWDTVAWLRFELGEKNLAIEASSMALRLAPENDREEMRDALMRIQASEK